MRIPVGPFYVIWILVQLILFNFGYYFLTGEIANLVGAILMILFFHIAVTLPVMSIMGQFKNENS